MRDGLKRCPGCGIMYEPTYGTQVYHSNECMERARSERRHWGHADAVAWSISWSGRPKPRTITKLQARLLMRSCGLEE